MKNRFHLATIISIVFILAVSVWFCSKKHGYYIDEYYQYTISNGTQLGISFTPGQWNDTSDTISQLVSEGDENFHFTQVYETASGDVHPPLYYYLLHFMSSIFTGRFSKWIGLSLNLLILIPTLIIVKKIAWILSGNNEAVTLITLLMFGLSPATLSMTLLIRMYLLLGLWTLLYAYIHLEDLKRDCLSFFKFLLPLMITGFLGFLTQYFFVVIMFFITFIYAFYLVVFCKRIKDPVIYGCAALLCLILTCPAWPFSYFHIFKGYRGQGAFSQFSDVSSFGGRFFKGMKWLDKLVFSGTLVLFATMMLCGAFLLIKHCVKKRKAGEVFIVRSLSASTKGFILLGIASLLDFIALCQISLMDNIMSSRQFASAYVLFLVLIPSGIYRLIKYIGKTSEKLPVYITAALTGIVLILGHVQKNVLFVFENENAVAGCVEQHPNAKAVMFLKDDGNYDSCIQELILFPEVYFVLISDLSVAKDPVIASADEIIAIISTEADSDECIKCITDQNPQIKNRELIMTKYNGYYDIYLLD